MFLVVNGGRWAGGTVVTKILPVPGGKVVVTGETGLKVIYGVLTVPVGVFTGLKGHIGTAPVKATAVVPERDTVTRVWVYSRIFVDDSPPCYTEGSLVVFPPCLSYPGWCRGTCLPRVVTSQFPLGTVLCRWPMRVWIHILECSKLYHTTISLLPDEG